jgi:hypothetical protein
MFDPKCLDLANHFLPSTARDQLKHQLAQSIQDAVEDYLVGLGVTISAALANREPRVDQEAIDAVPALRDKKAVVLYFETDEDREGFVRAIHVIKPGMRSVNL